MSIENLKTFGKFATFPLLGAYRASPPTPTQIPSYGYHMCRQDIRLESANAVFVSSSVTAAGVEI